MISNNHEKEHEVFNLFKSYYRSEFEKADLHLSGIKFRHFRIELFSRRTRFERIRDIFKNETEIKERISSIVPKNAYHTPVKWLSPIYVSKTKTETDVMLSSPLFFDIDIDLANSRNFNVAKGMLTNLIGYIHSRFNRVPDLVVFSGRKGFHIYYWEWDFEKIVTLSPARRIETFVKERSVLLKELKTAGILVDPTVTADPFRLMKIPNTLHGKTGLVARPVKDISAFNPSIHCLAFDRSYYNTVFNLDLEFYEASGI